MWAIEQHADFGRRQKDFKKKHRQELLNVLDNLDTFFRALQAGATPQQIKRGFIHPEPRGVLAIDQKGAGKHLKETRLYIYPDPDTCTLHVITVGDKASQKDDIKLASGFVEGLLRSKQQGGQNSGPTRAGREEQNQ